MKNRATLILLLIAVFSLTTQASPLSDARDAGHVVENPDGYVRAGSSAVPASIKALIKDVNQRRKDAYGEIARKNGVSVAQVAAESYKKRAKPK
jgi:hypothetical protein